MWGGDGSVNVTWQEVVYPCEWEDGIWPDRLLESWVVGGNIFWIESMDYQETVRHMLFPLALVSLSWL